MLSVLKSAWRVVARRAVSDKAVLAAASITVLLAIMSMASGPIYADAVATGSLRRQLADAPVAAANLTVTTRVNPAEFEGDDQLVRAAMSATFADTGGELYLRGSSGSYTPGGLAGAHNDDLVVFRFFSDIASRIDVVAGTWPATAAGANVAVAIPEPAAAALGVTAGDRFEVTSRSSPDESWQVAVAAVYRVKDRTDPYWYGDELDLDGVSAGVSFTTYGPFLVTADTYFATVGSGTSNMRWTVFPHHDQLTAAAVAGLQNRLGTLSDRLNAGRPMGNQMQVTTELPTLLADTERSLAVTRAAVLVVTIQLAILAGYALFLTAGLLADVREVESVTLVARGGEGRQLLTMSVMEGLLLTVPALAIAPPLTAFALRAFNHLGPLSDIGVVINPVVTAASWRLAAIAAVMCVAAIAIPTYRATRTTGSVRALRARPVNGGLARRAGADVALLGVAGIGLWQLARYGAALTRTVRGTLGIDPLLVAAPALALLAGAVLALRILPLLARVGEVGVARGRRAVAGLAIWHLGRQPRRYVRSALLLMLAVGMSFFALAYDATWRTSQTDQASFQVGADVAVTPARQADDSIPEPYLREAYRSLPGYEAASPVLESKGSLPGAGLPLEYVLLDADRAAEIVNWRADLAAEPLPALMGNLTGERRQLPGLVLDGQPTTVTATVAASLDAPADEDVDRLPETDYTVNAALRLVVADAYGTIFRVDLGPLDMSGATRQMTGQLGYALDNGQQLTLSFPIRIVGLEVRSLATRSPASPRTIHLAITDPVATGSSGSQQLDLHAVVEEASISLLRNPEESPEVARDWDDAGGMTIDLITGSSSFQTRQQVYFLLHAADPRAGTPLPVLASSDLLTELHLQVGDTIPLDTLAGYTGRGTITGELTAFPTVDPAQAHAVVLDYETYLTAVFAPGADPLPPNEYWLSVAAADRATTATLLGDTPFSSTRVITRDERRRELALDPVALGSLGALLLGIFAAALLALIGFVVNMTVSTRDRTTQFALMRAVGLSIRQLVTWVALENGAVIVFGMVAGTGLGIVLAAIALPLLTVTQQATTIVPKLLLVYPWPAILATDTVLLLALGLSVVAAGRMLHRLRAAELLRTGEG